MISTFLFHNRRSAMFVTNWDAAHCVISNFDTHYDNLSPEDDDYVPGKLWAEDDDLPLAGDAIDTEGLHVFYPQDDLELDDSTLVKEVPVCGFEGDTNPLDTAIEYMELDTRFCPVTGVLKPEDRMAGFW